jgi:hypothetical protein
MPTVASAAEVCNLALDLLRHKEQVVNLSPASSEVEALAARWYDVTRRSVLRAFPWNFARKRAALSLNAIDPAFGYPDAYSLPTDYVNLVFVGDNYDEDYETDYSIENQQILIDNSGATSLNVCYIRDVMTPGSFDPLFVDVLVGELALRFSAYLAGVGKAVKDVKEFRNEARAQARSKNGQENPPRVRSDSPLVNARFSVSRSTISDGKHLFS